MRNSSITRTVRRLDGSNEIDKAIGNQAIWKWLDDDNEFKCYTAEGMRQLEKAYQRKLTKTMLQGSNQKAYLVDFEAMVQYNERSQFPREIRRG